MVKIKDLSEKQLLSQIEKYQKIYSQLLAERDKRVAAGANLEDLSTNAEKEELEKQKIEQESEVKNEQDTDAFQLSIGDRELSSYNDENDNLAEQKEEEEVRATQLIKLSRGQLNELRMSGKKKR